MDPSDSDDQLRNELISIYSSCPKNEEGEVPIDLIIDVITNSFNITVDMRSQLKSNLDPSGLKQVISEAEFLKIMTKVVFGSQSENNSNQCVISSPVSYGPGFTSTPLRSGFRPRSLRRRVIDHEDEVRNRSCNSDDQVPSSLSSLGSYKEEISCLKSTNLDLKKKLEKTELLNTSLELDVSRERANNNALRKQIENLKDEVKRLEQFEVSHLDLLNALAESKATNARTLSNLEKVSKQVTELQNQNLETVSELKCLKERELELTKVIHEQKNLVEIQDMKVLHLETTNGRLKQQLDKASSELNHEQEKVASLIEQMAYLRSQKQKLQMELAEVSVSCTAMTLEHSDFFTPEHSLMSISIIADKPEYDSLKNELERINVNEAQFFVSESSVEGGGHQVTREVFNVSSQTDIETIRYRVTGEVVNVSTQTDFENNGLDLWRLRNTLMAETISAESQTELREQVRNEVSTVLTQTDIENIRLELWTLRSKVTVQQFSSQTQTEQREHDAGELSTVLTQTDIQNNRLELCRSTDTEEEFFSESQTELSTAIQSKLKDLLGTSIETNTNRWTRFERAMFLTAILLSLIVFSSYWFSCSSGSSYFSCYKLSSPITKAYPNGPPPI